MSDPSAPPAVQAETTEQPWHAFFPAPTLEAIFLPADEIYELLVQDEEAEKNGESRKTILVDLRRNDHDGRTIASSLNLPAQSLYTSLPTLLPILHRAGITTVAFYCGSSRGRGSRAAAWAREVVEKDDSLKGLRAVALEGGIKGWYAKVEEGGKEKKFAARTDRV